MRDAGYSAEVFRRIDARDLIPQAGMAHSEQLQETLKAGAAGLAGAAGRVSQTTRRWPLAEAGGRRCEEGDVAGLMIKAARPVGSVAAEAR